MKKIFSMVIALVMLLSFPAVVFAASKDERKLIEIHVENQDQIMEFYNSSKYNPDYRYSFIYLNPVQPRTLCPKCGNNTYKGYTEDLEWGIDPMPCPNPSPVTSDMVTNYHHNVWSACDTCGYKTSKTFQGIQLLRIECYVESWDLVVYWAKPGNSLAAGDDVHELMSTWGY